MNRLLFTSLLFFCLLGRSRTRSSQEDSECMELTTKTLRKFTAASACSIPKRARRSRPGAALADPAAASPTSTGTFGETGEIEPPPPTRRSSRRT